MILERNTDSISISGFFNQPINQWEFNYERIYIDSCIFYGINSNCCVFFEQNAQKTIIDVSFTRFVNCIVEYATSCIVFICHLGDITINKCCFSKNQGKIPAIALINGNNCEILSISATRSSNPNSGSLFSIVSTNSFQQNNNISDSYITNVFYIESNNSSFALCYYQKLTIPNSEIFELNGIRHQIKLSNFLNITSKSIFFSGKYSDAYVEFCIFNDCSFISHSVGFHFITFANCFNNNQSISTTNGVNYSKNHSTYQINAIDCSICVYRLNKTYYLQNMTRVFDLNEVDSIYISNCYFGDLICKENGAAIYINFYAFSLQISLSSFVNCCSFSKQEVNTGGAIHFSVYDGRFLLKNVCAKECISNNGLFLYLDIDTNSSYLNSTSVSQSHHSIATTTSYAIIVKSQCDININCSYCYVFKGSFGLMDSYDIYIDYSEIINCLSNELILKGISADISWSNIINNSFSGKSSIFDNNGMYSFCIFDSNKYPIFKNDVSTMVKYCCFDQEPNFTNHVTIGHYIVGKTQTYNLKHNFIQAECKIITKQNNDSILSQIVVILLFISTISLSIYFYVHLKSLKIDYEEHIVLTKNVIEDFG